MILVLLDQVVMLDGQGQQVLQAYLVQQVSLVLQGEQVPQVQQV